MATDLMQLADTPKSIYLPTRLVVNALAAPWIAAASWRIEGVTRMIGLIVAVSTALVLLPLWFLLVGRRLAREQAA
jgi:hypothetical protein